MLTPHAAILLSAAGLLGGALNSVAGGGSFITFPAILATGVPPISSNATSSVALWTGTTASGGAYRKHLGTPWRVAAPLMIAGIAGGAGGAILLIHTPPETFLRVIPWLMLGATLLFAFGRKSAGQVSAAAFSDPSRSRIAVAAIFELLIAIYGGYFGGGIGIMNLALLTGLGMINIHAMNALKVVLGSVINGVAVLTFIATHSVSWTSAIPAIIGAMAGGYLGAHYAQKLPPHWIRWFVILVGAGMSIYFFQRAY